MGNSEKTTKNKKFQKGDRIIKKKHTGGEMGGQVGTIEEQGGEGVAL